MSILEDRLRDTMTEMADEVRPVSMLQRLEHAAPRRHTHRRTYLATAAAAAIIAALVAGSLILLRAGDPRIIEPVDHPPKVIRLSSAESSAPGRASLLLVIAPNRARDFVHEKRAYVLPVGGHRAVLVKESDGDGAWNDHLSIDGTRLVRQLIRPTDGGVGAIWTPEIVDLRDGTVDELRAVHAVCPALSPDNRMLAVFHSEELALIDVATGSTRTERRVGRGVSGNECPVRFAWSPDGRRIVIPDDPDSLVVDRRGRIRSRMTGVHATNGSMSWSPDGRVLLLYEAKNGRFLARDMKTRTDTALQRPPDAVEPVGWAGSRIVWLLGDVGDQRLVATDGTGRDPRLWARLDTNGLPIESVSWSSALAGTAR